jgi:peroxiredoxin
VKNINTLSDYKGASNARKYGSVIVSPKFLEEFFARTVYIVMVRSFIADNIDINKSTVSKETTINFFQLLNWGLYLMPLLFPSRN